MRNEKPHNYRPHFCELSEDFGGLAKLPPNASFRTRFIRYLRILLAPNPKAKICKRNYRNQSQINAERRRHAKSKYFLVIHPYSDLQFYRELLFVFIGLYEISTAPINASFGYVWRLGEGNIVYVADVLSPMSLTLFVVELFWIFSCFFAAYKEPSTKTIQLNHWKIIKRYLLTYFIVDLLFLSPPVTNDDYEAVIYWVNILIFFRLNTLVTYIKRFLADIGAPRSIIAFTALMAISFFMNHVLACVFYIVPLLFTSDTGELWLVRTNLHPYASGVKVYASCFSMIQNHFWGLGEASTKVQNIWENIILITTMIIGRLWSLYLIATMLRVFTLSSLSESKYEEYLMQLRTFIDQKQLPDELADRLLEYYRYKYQHHYFNEQAIFSAMSSFLKQEVLLYGARNVISKVALFKFFPRSMIGLIISKCRTMVFLNHDVIVSVGDLIENVYFVSCGTLAVFNKDGIELAHLSDGEELGIEGVVSMSNTFFNYTFTSIETTEMYVITIKEFRAIIYNKNDILKYFGTRVEERVRDMENIEVIASAQGLDLLSALHHGKVLERPRIRTRYFDR